jgi:hypothetical protein
LAARLDQLVSVYLGDDQLRRRCGAVGGDHGHRCIVEFRIVDMHSPRDGHRRGNAGMLLVIGATILLTMTRTPIDISSDSSNH